MDTNERRKLLAPIPNPDTDHEIMVQLERLVTFPENQKSINVRIMYVPDRLVLPSENLESYFSVISNADYNSLESLAVRILDDINNEIVPCWVQVDISTLGKDGSEEVNTLITAIDRQPDWDNPNLLSRINK
jgi:7-cyano-7-deazaguanine reductase